MFEQNSIDVASLKMVFEELNESFLKASYSLEAFASEPEFPAHIESCHHAVSQATGVLNLLNIACAYKLSSHLLLVIDQLKSGKARNQTFALKVTGHALVGLPCYLEFLIDKANSCPPLIMPFVNELRAALCMPLIFESQVESFRIDNLSLKPLSQTANLDNEALIDLFSRMRTMYQVGLIDLVYDKNTLLKLQLMHRAMSRLAAAVSNSPSRTLWRLTEAVLESFISGYLELTFTRKRVLLMVDSALREALREPDAFNLEGRTTLIVELVYLINLATSPHSASKEVMAELSLKPFKHSDHYWQDQRAVMHGPNTDTVKIVISTVLDDLSLAKGSLEVFAENINSEIDFSDMLEIFEKNRKALEVIGARDVSLLLGQLSNDIKQFSHPVDQEGLLFIADALLHTESLLRNLTRLDLHNKGKTNKDILQNKQVMMKESQIQNAEIQLTNEALENLNKAKQSFNSFLESDHLPSIIQEIVGYISAVKGALDMLGHSRAGVILFKLNATLQQAEDDNNLVNNDALFQSVADTLIALEYYLIGALDQTQAPLSVLVVAEQSLEALVSPKQISMA